MDLKHTTKEKLYEMLCAEQGRAMTLEAIVEKLREENEDIESRIKVVRKERDEYARRYYRLFNHPWKALWAHIRRAASL